MLIEDAHLLFIGRVLWVEAPDDQGVCHGVLACRPGGPGRDHLIITSNCLIVLSTRTWRWHTTCRPATGQGVHHYVCVCLRPLECYDASSSHQFGYRWVLHTKQTTDKRSKLTAFDWSSMQLTTLPTCARPYVSLYSAHAEHHYCGNEQAVLPASQCCLRTARICHANEHQGSPTYFCTC
jgi:hypothetical protein